MNRRLFIALFGTLTASGCIENQGNSTPSLEQRKSQARELEYEELNRNYEDYIGDYIHFPEAIIINANENRDGEGYSYGMNVGGGFWVQMWVEYSERFVQGDNVEFWGEVVEIDNVQNVPDIDAIDINILNRN